MNRVFEIASVIVALSVAAMQRKQMRQIELHRVNPTVPLVPPPHPVTQFFKVYGAPIFSIILNTGFLIHDLRQTGPITRGQVFSIALDTGAIFSMIVLIGALLLFNITAAVARQTVEMFDRFVNLFRQDDRPTTNS